MFRGSIYYRVEIQGAFKSCNFYGGGVLLPQWFLRTPGMMSEGCLLFYTRDVFRRSFYSRNDLCVVSYCDNFWGSLYRTMIYEGCFTTVIIYESRFTLAMVSEGRFTPANISKCHFTIAMIFFVDCFTPADFQGSFFTPIIRVVFEKKLVIHYVLTNLLDQISSANWTRYL